MSIVLRLVGPVLHSQPITIPESGCLWGAKCLMGVFGQEMWVYVAPSYRFAGSPGRMSVWQLLKAQ